MNKRIFAVGKRMSGRNYVRTAGGEWVEVKTDEKAR
jgi:hypothetical protein